MCQPSDLLGATPDAPAARALWAVPVSLLYGAWVGTRRRLYDAGLLPEKHNSLPLACVGGLEAGGTGKTPVTAMLLAQLIAQGRRPGLLTRGYGRRSRGLVLRPVGEPASAAEVGDEAAMVVGQHDVPVAVCAARWRGAQALAALGCDCAVMDDGFAHRALRRDLDLVVLRGEGPLAALRLLPWGSLREPPAALCRAGLIWLHYRDAGAPEAVPKAWRRALAQVGCRAPVLMSHAGSGALVDALGAPVDGARARVVGAAGIARPYEFARHVAEVVAQVAHFVPLADHHPYSDGDVALLERLVHRSRAQALVVTAKDAVKLAGRVRAPLWVLGRRLRLVDPDQALARALAALGATVAS